MEKKNMDSSDRRSFIRKFARLGAAGGIAALLSTEKTLIPPVQASPAYLAIDALNIGTGTTELRSSTELDAFIARNTGGGWGVLGVGALGVWGTGNGQNGTGVWGMAIGAGGATKGVIGNATSTDGISIGVEGMGDTGVYGETSSTYGIGVDGYASTTSTVTIGVRGRSKSQYGHGVDGIAETTSTGGAIGVYGVSHAPDGYGVNGYVGPGTGPSIGVYGASASSKGIGIEGRSGNASAIPIVAEGWTDQTANLQVWRNVLQTPLSVINKDGWMGVGISSPARSIHLKGDQACFRMDRNVNSSAFILVRTSPDFSSVWKTFYVGVDASGVNNGEFFIGDVGTNVSGPSAKRLWIDNSGGVHIPNLISGDIALANDFIVTEDEKHGIAFKNDVGEKIAVLDREGNFHIKGKVMEDL